MTKQIDYFRYYLNRAATERELARTESDKAVADAHIKAAVRYESLAQKVAAEDDLSGKKRPCD